MTLALMLAAALSLEMATAPPQQRTPPPGATAPVPPPPPSARGTRPTVPQPSPTQPPVPSQVIVSPCPGPSGGTPMSHGDSAGTLSGPVSTTCSGGPHLGIPGPTVPH